METKGYSNQPPVAFERHYQIFKRAERKVLEELARAEQEKFLIGLRVAYDAPDSPNEPLVLPYTVEFGYLAPVDNLLRCGQEDAANGFENWQKTTRSGVSVHGITLEFMDELFTQIRSELKEDIGLTAEFNMGVFVVLYGSPINMYGIMCSCPRYMRRYCSYNPITKTNGIGACTAVTC